MSNAIRPSKIWIEHHETSFTEHKKLLYLRNVTWLWKINIMLRIFLQNWPLCPGPSPPHPDFTTKSSQLPVFIVDYSVAIRIRTFDNGTFWGSVFKWWKNQMMSKEVQTILSFQTSLKSPLFEVKFTMADIIICFFNGLEFKFFTILKKLDHSKIGLVTQSKF